MKSSFLMHNSNVHTIKLTDKNFCIFILTYTCLVRLILAYLIHKQSAICTESG